MRDLPAPATSVRWRWSFATAACGATPSAPASSTRRTGARRSASSLRSACRHRSRSTPLSALHCSRPREPSRDSSVRAPEGRVRTEEESAAPSREGEARPAAGKASHARPTLAPLVPASQDIAEAQGRLGQPDDIAKASPHPAGPALSRYSCVAAICRASRPLPALFRSPSSSSRTTPASSPDRTSSQTAALARCETEIGVR